MSLYLELLKKILVNSIYEDVSIHPGHDGSTHYNHLRATGDDWPRQAHTMIGRKRLDNLHYCLRTITSDMIPGHIIETGVFRGGTCIFVAGFLKQLESDRLVYVADSFAGFPGGREEDKGDQCLTQNHYFSVSRKQVEDNFKKYDLLTPNVVFLEGWFSDTLPTLNGPFAILRLDGDMYSSTMDALVNLYPKLNSGGFCIVDDYKSHPSCKRAVDEYRSANGITGPIIEIDNQGIFWRETR